MVSDVNLHHYSEDHVVLTDAKSAGGGRAVRSDPGLKLKAHPVSSFDCEKDETLTFNLNLEACFC